MNKVSSTLHIFIKTFLITIVINSIVISAHILKSRHFNLGDSFRIVLLAIEASAVLFAIIYAFLYMISFLIKSTRGKKFWIIMLIGLVATTISFISFDGLFAAYNDSPAMIAAISAFSFLVSLTYQYELFIGNKSREEVPG